ncbi:uncharacterized protein [Apostichopus japonicus]|uniref:uncharacterized protein n=1 Tax=Stichopus japonicus TaxID=307972 RepID=UPI003AB90AB3
MEDYKNFVNDDKIQIEEPPQYPGQQHLGSTNTVTMAQPVPHVPQIIRSPEDLEVISSIKTKATLSLVLSIMLFLFSWTMFCTIPAIVCAIMALTGIDTNIYKAADHAKHAANLTGVAIGSTVIQIIIGVIYIFSYGYLNGK